MPIRRLSLRLGSWLVLTSTMLAAQPFPDAHDLPPDCWTGPIFRLSQDYPRQLPAPADLPWSGIDFKTDPKGYMQAVLKYAYEGNLDVDWEVQNNRVRRWYHAPWLHWGEAGREFIHGMTRERHSRPKELAETQVTEAQTWAVGVYNELGGYTLGRVWANPNAPNPVAARFREGTVAVKLLFTNAPLAEVPYLEGAKEWQAHITSSPGQRETAILRLLQVDFAVRDGRADPTGWVFGTFQYHRDASGATPWHKLVPVALTWGNDPGATPDAVAHGDRLIEESWVNPDAPIVKYRTESKLPLGWAGRANGPVDNPLSSCLSCHATALYPSTVPLAPKKETLEEDRLLWFQNLRAGDSLDPEQAQSLDYSLQLAAGIGNFYRWVEMVRSLGVVPARPPQSKPAFLQRSHEDGPFLIYGCSREEDEQEPIRLLPAPREVQHP